MERGTRRATTDVEAKLPQHIVQYASSFSVFFIDSHDSSAFSHSRSSSGRLCSILAAAAAASAAQRLSASSASVCIAGRTSAAARTRPVCSWGWSRSRCSAISAFSYCAATESTVSHFQSDFSGRCSTAAFTSTAAAAIIRSVAASIPSHRLPRHNLHSIL